MARPVSVDTANKIIIHTNGGHRYASTKTHITDDTGKKRYVYRHWGTVDAGNKFHPNATYFYAPVSERFRTWSEAAKHGRMFICFIGLILASYVRSVHKQNEYLRTKFASIEDILAEMRSIRCIEHEGRLKFVTPFVGAQVDICKAFGFDIPDGCAPSYTSRKKSLTPKRGRPAKPKVEHQEL